MMAAMADISTAHVPRPLRVLVSEGNSTSAREAITVLGLSGHEVEVCDPNPLCLARFSRFVRKIHRCPGLRDDPAGFLAFVEHLLATGNFDVLLPTHEQGFVFARADKRLSNLARVALPDFESYRTAHHKACFSRLLDRLGLPQPATHIVNSEAELRAAIRFPSVIKTAVSTASRGVWFVRHAGHLDRVLRDFLERSLNEDGSFADEVLVQDLVVGTTGKAQAIFSRGRLSGFHGYRQIAAGAGGGEAIKQSESRPEVRAYLARIGEHLAWHGALSVDYIITGAEMSLLIDCNPRLVEPMSAYLSGVDLVGLLLAVSLEQPIEPVPSSRDGVRTHLAIQALLGCALQGGNRRELMRQCWNLAAGRGAYADSAEELTPVRQDWMSIVPLLAVAISLLIQPKLAATIAQKGWGAHLLDNDSIDLISREDFH